MKQEIKELEINGITYVPKGTETSTTLAPTNDGYELVIIRSERAGVHYGYLLVRNGTEVTLQNARRLWYWDGACSLSQLALDGVTKPQNCKFSVTVEQIIILGVCEILYVSKKAKKIIDETPIWKQ